VLILKGGNMLITKKIKITLIALALGVFSLPGSAQVEKCQDKDGKWHYGSGLGSVCENSSEIKSVKTDNISDFPDNSSNSYNEEELAKLELKVMGQDEYLEKDIDKILAPYKTAQDIQNRFDRLKASISSNIIEKTNFIRALNSRNKQLKINSTKEQDVDLRKTIDVKIESNSKRSNTFQSEISQLNDKLNQIEERRKKVVYLFNQFFDRKDKQG
jgi:hypothetical protein